MTDDPAELSPPRLPDGADAGWAVSELFEAAWVISGRDPAELRSPQSQVVGSTISSSCSCSGSYQPLSCS